MADTSKHEQQGLLPPIDITRSRFNLNTYYGRLRHFITITSPLTLLRSENDLRRAQNLLKDYASGNRSDLDESVTTQEQIWEAKQLVESSLHPDTHEPIPLPFRLSAFVPTNLVIATGLLLPNPSLVSIIGWQWANQTLNVCLNYANANKSTSLSSRELGTAYVAATATSVGLAVGLSRLARRAATGSMIGRFVPFVAVASAGCVNVGLMRWKEIQDGIDVFPPDIESPQSLGKSKTAGLHAVSQTAASRVLTNIPTLIIPPLVIAALQKRGTFGGPRGKALELITNLGLVGGSLFLFLPPAIAAFPQRATISVSRLEQEFKGLVNPHTGSPYTTVEFNKGL
ncbi:uncharacterized protein MELLADRAFT_46189 [Melampsora larici-populina 98AG31]|uniref:Sidoreflexin n=1 Tax=Melampsora larici-populina (strain 98AG31 / pathotype 3-4-7) TaxID=747676 RepID=F4SC73_MELLP|nr:uncharacterized protein MELLADRAFT_46189 [Melampsora larici-populina 98AG31]EGF97756.1 hypothetical protein MELLADRAFT_46189 [Melampsora larici-populina 98AG31]